MKPLARRWACPSSRDSCRAHPGPAYRDKLLQLQGDIEAQVFDGRIVARNLRVRDPLGRFPRVSADIEPASSIWT